MSRIGKVPIEIVDKVDITIDDRNISIKGPKGSFRYTIPELVNIRIVDKKLYIDRTEDTKDARRIQGLVRSLMKNYIQGVSTEFEKSLEIIGLGYKAEIKERAIVLHVGFSSPIIFPLPDKIEASIQKNIITIRGADKQLVGETAAKIRRIKPPEPYKGKGIRYKDEEIIKKAGKARKARAK